MCLHRILSSSLASRGPREMSRRTARAKTDGDVALRNRAVSTTIIAHNRAVLVRGAR